MTSPALFDFVERHPRLLVLTGAGCSTASGIPDYRDGSGEWKRTPPVMLQRFLADDYTRRRYWARSLVGWRRMAGAQPNEAHRALATLESDGRIELLVTQNVDGLHQAAGSRNVVDLHGRVDMVRCLGCEQRLPRAVVQEELVRRNPWFADREAGIAPDGDADLDGLDFSAFDLLDCTNCGGLLKPDVVFFGEGVPKARVERTLDALHRSDAMLVVGSSLMVYSGYRFVQAMSETGKPIAAINLGRTRGDDLLSLKITEDCAEVLSALVGCT